MSNKKDPYSSEAETQALLVPDTRTSAERKLDRMLEKRGASEQGAEPFLILRQIALQLLAEQSAQQTCNCRWEGDAQVQQCTLHEAHVDAIHEWAERAKTAEAKLKAQPAQQPLTDEQLSDLMPTPQQTGKPAIYSAFDLLWAMRATERAHGIGEKK